MALHRRAAWQSGVLVLAAMLGPANAQDAAPSLEARLDRLVAAYPKQLSGHDADRIYWRDGTAMPIGERAPDRPYVEKLAHASILDQLSLPYPRGAPAAPPEPDADPGRFRSRAFFEKMYGDCKRGEVAAHLVPVVWLPHQWGRTVMVTAVNGVADRLKAVSIELDALPSWIAQAAYPSAGTYNCRPVADAGQPSMHAFGAAIDLNVSDADYWLWQRPPAGGRIVYRNRMSAQIVDIFERHGFIWGGRWYHYDTMHFEYRPELIEPETPR